MRKNGIEKQKLGYEYIFNKWDRVEIHGPFLMQKIRKEGMPVAGRKPKPTAVKKLEGNPGKEKTE